MDPSTRPPGTCGCPDAPAEFTPPCFLPRRASGRYWLCHPPAKPKGQEWSSPGAGDREDPEPGLQSSPSTPWDMLCTPISVRRAMTLIAKRNIQQTHVRASGWPQPSWGEGKGKGIHQKNCKGL